jgi:hypothetical protein
MSTRRREPTAPAGKHHQPDREERQPDRDWHSQGVDGRREQTLEVTDDVHAGEHGGPA